MSAVRSTLPPRELDVGRAKAARHAADSFIKAAPAVASGRARASMRLASTSPSSKSRRSTFHFQRHYQDAMDAHEVASPTSVQHQHHVEEEVPVLPRKSALRASRLLDGLKISPTAQPLGYPRSHHAEYLSSEEDASSTSGDFSDFEYDSSSDDAPPRSEGCTEHVEARVVSVVYSGKPSVVDVPQPRRSISPVSIERPSSTGGLADKAFKFSALKNRRMSVSTTMSAHCTSSNLRLPPPRPHQSRSISMQPPSAAIKSRLDFLRIDPYAHGNSYSLSPSPVEPLEPRTAQPLEEDDRPKTPKSPSGKASMFRGVARAMSLMKKKSTPKLDSAYLAPGASAVPSPRPASPPGTSETTAEFPSMTEAAQHDARKPASETATSPAGQQPRPQLQASIIHDEIVVAPERDDKLDELIEPSLEVPVDHVESPTSPMPSLQQATPNAPPNKRMSMFGFGKRRMSMKGPVGKF